MESPKIKVEDAPKKSLARANAVYAKGKAVKKISMEDMKRRRKNKRKESYASYIFKVCPDQSIVHLFVELIPIVILGAEASTSRVRHLGQGYGHHEFLD
jgi:thiaminase